MQGEPRNKALAVFFNEGPKGALTAILDMFEHQVLVDRPQTGRPLQGLELPPLQTEGHVVLSELKAMEIKFAFCSSKSMDVVLRAKAQKFAVRTRALQEAPNNEAAYKPVDALT